MGQVNPEPTQPSQNKYVGSCWLGSGFNPDFEARIKLGSGQGLGIEYPNLTHEPVRLIKLSTQVALGEEIYSSGWVQVGHVRVLLGWVQLLIYLHLNWVKSG